MPLRKNGEIYKLTEEDKKNVRREVGHRFPVKFKMPDEWIVPDKENKGRFKRPQGVNIPTTFSIADGDEYATWMWGKQFIQKPGSKLPGEVVPSDRMIEFGVELPVGENQMDLLFFLLFKCPLLKGSPVAQPGQAHHFYIENRERMAESKNEFRKLKATVDNHILSVYSSTKVRLVAAAFDMPGVMLKNKKGDYSISDAEVRELLLNSLERLGKEKGYEHFNKMTKLSDEVEMRGYARYLQDHAMLSWHDTNGWALMKDNKPHKYLTKLIGQNDALQSLVAFLKKNPDEYELFKDFANVSFEEEATDLKPTPVKGKPFQKKVVEVEAE